MKEGDLKNLVTSLRDLVEVSINDGNLDYGVLTGKKEILDRVILTVITDKKTDKVIAFNCLSYMPCTLGHQKINVIHLGLIVVHPEVRLGGISWILYGLTTTLLYIRNRFQPIWISNVTQVPAVIGKVTEAYGDVYPNPVTRRPLSFKHLVLAREIMKNHRHVFGVGEDAFFNEKKFIIENSYTGGSDHLKKTFDEAPKHRHEVFNNFCRDHLDYQRGDDFLQIGMIKTEIIYQYLMREIPAKSFLSIIGVTLYMLISGVILPLAYWFQANKYQGIVRPWKT
jgi:hypothetical protein